MDRGAWRATVMGLQRLSKLIVDLQQCVYLFNCFLFLATPCGMWDLSSLTRLQTHIPCVGRQSLNHWTTREVPTVCLYFFFSIYFY